MKKHLRKYEIQTVQVGNNLHHGNKQIVQARLKKLGQRWTPKGLQQVANLRVAYHSKRWELVKNAIKNAA